MNRREFVLSAASAAALHAQTPPTRSKINGLPSTDPIVVKYAKAVGLMKALPASDNRSWPKQAAIHNNFCPHGNWWFLPWHRAYIAYFEAICRDVLGDPTFALPYWDWSANNVMPAPFTSPGNLKDANRSSTTVDATEVALSRVKKLVGSTNLLDIFSGSTTTDQQRQGSTQGELEFGPHNHVHSNIGGDMGTFLSPLDPIFWLHHCNIDRIWASWAKVAGHNPPAANLWKNHSLTTFWNPKTKTQVQVPVSDTISKPFYIAKYDALVTPNLVLHVIPNLSLLSMSIRTPVETPNVRLAMAEAAPTPVAAGNVSKFSIKSDPKITESLQKAGREATMPERTQTVYLYLEGVTAPTDDSTAYRVFLNCKQPGITTPVSDPTYAGTINFFGAGHGDHGNAVSFALDVTQTLGKLVSQGVYSANTPIEAAFVPVNVRKTEMVIKSDVKVQKIRLVSLGQA